MEEFAMAVGTLERLKGTLNGFTEATYHIGDRRASAADLRPVGPQVTVPSLKTGYGWPRSRR
jgi:hypothetical protein